MSTSNFIKILNNAKFLYKSIGSIHCKKLGSQPVYFSASGFKHLLMKNRKFRPLKEQIRKLLLIKYIDKVMNNEQALIKTRSIHSNVSYTSISAMIHKKEIKIIIRKYNNGYYHFWSIMDK